MDQISQDLRDMLSCLNLRGQKKEGFFEMRMNTLAHKYYKILKFVSTTSEQNELAGIFIRHKYK